MAASKISAIRFADVDTVTSVSRSTADAMGKEFGMSRSKLVHLALAQLRDRTYAMQYPSDLYRQAVQNRVGNPDLELIDSITNPEHWNP